MSATQQQEQPQGGKVKPGNVDPNADYERPDVPGVDTVDTVVVRTKTGKLARVNKTDYNDPRLRKRKGWKLEFDDQSVAGEEDEDDPEDKPAPRKRIERAEEDKKSAAKK